MRFTVRPSWEARTYANANARFDVHAVAAIQENGRQRFTVSDLKDQLMPLLKNLFGAFQKAESGENEYLMKTVMRVITFVGPEVCLLRILVNTEVRIALIHFLHLMCNWQC